MIGIFNEEVRRVRDEAVTKKFRAERKLRRINREIQMKQENIIKGNLDSKAEFDEIRRELALLERDKMICKRNIESYCKAFEATTLRGMLKETEVGKVFINELRRIERRFAAKIIDKVEEGEIKL